MGRIRTRPLTVALVSCAATVLLAQEQPPTFKVNVRLVRLLATIKDVMGKPVGDLTRQDFAIYDNGVRQQIEVFERHTEQPLSVALLLDTSGSTAKELKYETDSLTRFLKALFREGNPDDSASMFSFNWEVQQRVRFSRNLDNFEKAMRRLKAEAGTSMYDAIYLAAQELESREGRKVMVVITDGGDTTSTKRFQDALEALHVADTVLYSVLVMPITSEAGRNIGGENALQTMSSGTGGRVFYPSIGAALDQAFDDILRELRTQYLIGFYPKDVPPSTDRFHRIRVEMSRPGLHVLTRTGYYGDFADENGPSPQGRGPKVAR